MTPKMHEGEVDTDVALVRRLLAAQHPQWAGLPVEPVRSTGTVNAIYRLGDDMCVRLPRVESWAGDLQKELQWLPILAPHLPLAVPMPLAHGHPSDGYPFEWAVFGWLPGEVFVADRVHDEHVAAADLARFVAALRRVDPAGGPRSRRARPLTDVDDVTRAAIAAASDVIDSDAATAAWEASLSGPAWDGSLVWTHSDLLPPNLIVDHGRVFAVIDFGSAGVGDPATDLIAAWAVLSRATRDVFRAALDVDDATWRRGRGAALTQALLIIPYYPDTNPGLVTMAKRTVNEVVDDFRRRG